MPSRNIPNVNASLIREIRMIAQQAFAAFRNGSEPRVQQRYKQRSPFYQGETLPVTLECCFCLRLRTKPKVAVTVQNGQAVCGDHIFYVQDGDFGRIRDIIQKQPKQDW